MSGRRREQDSSPTNGFSSTPLKTTCPGREEDDFDHGVLSSDEDTFSLLSPIYHDSFDSDDEDDVLRPAGLPIRRFGSTVSLDRNSYELPTVPAGKMPAASPSLSAWEQWLVNKAKEDRLKLEKTTKEGGLLKLRRQQEEDERKQKKIDMEEKIKEWLKVKREQEKHKQLEKQGKEEEETQRRLDKQREVEMRARQKYRDWLQMKNKAKVEKRQKEKEEAVLKEEQEKERRKKVEENFKEWVAKANERSSSVSKSPCSSRSPYDNSYPSPSFYNPIPWRPLPIPPPEPGRNQAPKQRKGQQSSRINCRLRNSASAAQMLQKS